MKKIITLTVLLLVAGNLLACDICGCGVGSYYLGILPDFKKRFIGLRYQHKGLTTHISADGSVSYLTSQEIYQTAEVWGAFNIGKRFRIMGFVPVNFNERLNQGKTTSKSGMGDIAVLGYFKLLDRQKTIGDKRFAQSLWVGGGIKLPVGTYDPTDANIAQNTQNTFQLGTGSVDFTVNAMYDVRLQDAGINTNVSYKINTANKYDYRYGNKLTGNVLAYYKFNIKNKLTIAPNAGIMYETAQKDLNARKHFVDESGGYSMMGILGVECNIKNIAFGGNYQSPLAQTLAGNRVKAKDRFMVHVSFSF
ncbi:transporter [Panacibacter sp. DH6]|uniref:Transporter n=1 Tax=Panacibacter microcysteis TaxID=2793269 RepID=A0A931GUG1_9BACT|nr:transporter [Panacibacter microcysteis]MBG9376631.1 transporter [Panacibacter microcysteis]